VDFNTHVYCTDCKWFRLDDGKKPYCVYEDICDIWNCEDSKPFRERPYYEFKIGLTSEKKAGLKQIMGKYSGKASLSTIKSN